MASYPRLTWKQANPVVRKLVETEELASIASCRIPSFRAKRLATFNAFKRGRDRSTFIGFLPDTIGRNMRKAPTVLRPCIMGTI